MAYVYIPGETAGRCKRLGSVPCAYLYYWSPSHNQVDAALTFGWVYVNAEQHNSVQVHMHHDVSLEILRLLAFLCVYLHDA